jgi:hypothetical protein
MPAKVPLMPPATLASNEPLHHYRPHKHALLDGKMLLISRATCICPSINLVDTPTTALAKQHVTTRTLYDLCYYVCYILTVAAAAKGILGV